MQAYETVDDFFPEADALRAEIDAHFSDPYAHAAERHQIWNYWFVPEHYTYLRTDPRKVFSQPLFDRFFEHLQAEVFERWGLAHVTHPYLSVYVAGCHQALHNDALAGQMGYVVSLTRWDERRFSGGETLIFREEPYFGDAAMTRAAGARKFYDLVPADFNRLLVFDDRIPHGVQRIEGSMNPFEGRIVLHGHLSAGQPEVEGPLAEPTHTPRMIDLVADYMKRCVARADDGLDGFLVVRANLSPAGEVLHPVAAFDRVLRLSDEAKRGDFDAAAIASALADYEFPAAEAPSRITIPIRFGTG